ncbi:MAG: serine/threonine-protein kinase M1 [Peltula sp. TS41687]|nr:MAG: serine/threonine-protein kinase M1 [Peltula sp. TS41687]
MAPILSGQDEFYSSTNGNTHSNETPPATITAQIVNQLSISNGQSKVEDQGGLEQLLSVILDQGGLEDEYFVPANSDKILILIHVVTQAGLDVLLQDNPFEGKDYQLLRALRCLLVLQMTIQQKSQNVLFNKYAPNMKDKTTQPPFFIWILPRWLVLLECPQLEPLHEKIIEVILAGFRVAANSSDPCNTTRFLLYVNSCITGLLDYLQDGSDTAHASFEAATPPRETLEKICPGNISEQAIETCQIKLQSPIRACRLLPCLISLAVTASTEDTSVVTFLPLNNRLFWAVDCLAKLHDFINHSEDGSNPISFNSELNVLLLRNLRFVTREVSNLGQESVALKAVSLLFQLESSLLGCPADSLDDRLQKELSMALLGTSRTIEGFEYYTAAFDSILIPAIRATVEDEARFKTLSKYLQFVLGHILRLRPLTAGDWAALPTHAPSMDLDDVNNVDSDIDANLKELHMNGEEIVDQSLDRPRKRRRITNDQQFPTGQGLMKRLIEEVYGLLGSEAAPDLHGLAELARNEFMNLSIADQSRALHYLGHIPCAASETLTTVISKDGSIESMTCSDCDPGYPLQNKRETRLDEVENELFRTLQALLETRDFQHTVEPRVWAMSALRKLVVHSQLSVNLDLAASFCGTWCLQSHRSTLRDLRIAAGKTLPAYLAPDIPLDILRQNRIVAFDYLRKVSETPELGFQETCVRSWSQLARVCVHEELNIVLLRLVEYFGHTNPLLLRVANAKHINARGLLNPFWRSIAILVVKVLQSRPQTAQVLCEMLNMSVEEFLVQTQAYTLPYLVLLKKRDLVQRIAQACGGDNTAARICTESANLPSILALLLVHHSSHHSSEVETVIMATLCSISEQFRDYTLADLTFMQPMHTAYELLKVAGDEDEGKRARAHRGIILLANLTPRKSHQSRKLNAIGAFFEDSVLGINVQFSDAVNESPISHSIPEKKRCLRGIEEMIKLAKGHISIALPQIGACLQSAMEMDDLRDQAFSVWATMMMTLEEDDLRLMVENTFSIVVSIWNSLEPNTKERAIIMVTHLFENHPTLIDEKIGLLPSLQSIPGLSNVEEVFQTFKSQVEKRQNFQAFIQRCQHENVTVVSQALKELLPYLRENQSFLHQMAVSEQPDPIVSELMRVLLDACVKLASERPEVADHCAQCIGIIGCLDSNRIEAIREDQDILLLNNFENSEEAVNWAIFFLREILVKAYMSATNPRSHGLLGYVMQELLQFCGLDTNVIHRGLDIQNNASYRRWIALPEAVRNCLTPFLTSHYMMTRYIPMDECVYPIFPEKPTHSLWLRTFVALLLRKGMGHNAERLFPVCSHIIRQDISIANFLLPYVVLNVIVGRTEDEAEEVGRELLLVLKYQVDTDSHLEKENLRLCSETVFQVLDYLSKWLQEKRKQAANIRNHLALQGGRPHPNSPLTVEMFQIERVESVLHMIPAEVISQRAVECKSFARALFYWEQYIREERNNAQLTGSSIAMEPLFERLQDIYTQIDEPDGIEGISAHLHVLNIDQQILEHRKAGRWAAAQSWFELKLAENPEDIDVQINLLTCLKESGQHDVLLNHIEGLPKSQSTLGKLLPFVMEASWATGKWSVLARYVDKSTDTLSGDFNVDIGHALLALYEKDYERFTFLVQRIREGIAKGLSRTTTASLQACHSELLELHVLSEIEMISGFASEKYDREVALETLDLRLPILGAFVQDKQYLLGLRRAAMQLSTLDFKKEDEASAWLTSARLARKGQLPHQSFNAVMHAYQLGAVSAKIEHSRLLWNEGQHRKAIQSLEGAIAANAFKSYNNAPVQQSKSMHGGSEETQQNILTARRDKHNRMALFQNIKTQQRLMSGFGAKYIYQTLPRVLTLWLDLGSQVDVPFDPKHGLSEFDRSELFRERQENLETIHKNIHKYLEKGQAFVFYTAFTQIVARICHPNKAVFGMLQRIILRVVSAHPQQALWTLLALVKSSSKDRATRGAACLSRIKDTPKRGKSETGHIDLKTLINQGQRLSDQLLQVCEGEIQGRPSHVSLSKELGFNHRSTPCGLVVPLETTLSASLPIIPDTMKAHRAFSADTITISAILDDVLVLNSLQRPRRISVRGSDGRVYGLLCKPKDDLRKDQRLMEFNAMINRSLKKDADSSKRRLYIKTYAVTPLNEECGLIEWVDNLRTLRDIILSLYKSKGIAPNYTEIRLLLDEASSHISKLPIFTGQVLPSFPPVFHEWFIEMFPEPGAWFTARLKYTRSCAVMSMVGMVLGLGDRHGENILFEEGNGGTFHVDFNCLFDKGLTFEKPERVPFRLTQNMIDAFGVYGYEGPFRKSCELTLKVLRSTEDNLMTILETFVYDPTTDFIGKKKRSAANVPETPQDVLDSVRGKVRGLLPGESVTLSVEGHVHELIQQAVDPRNLASMYIGWCAFF